MLYVDPLFLTYLYLYLYIDPTSLFNYIYLIISRTALVLSYILLRNVDVVYRTRDTILNYIIKPKVLV